MSMRYPAGGFLTAIYRAELAPNSPSITSTSAGILSATIGFSAPSSGPTPTSYLAVSSPGGLTGTSTTSPITVTGLTSGQAYTFTVYAVNSYNNSAAVTTSSVTPVSGYTTFVWGYNVFGKLGLGNTTNYSSPKQLGSVSSWVMVTSGYKGSSGLKNDGTMWGWGYNNFGQSGLNNTTTYSSPKQVGALTNWAKFSRGPYQVLAIKTDGTLWTWGYNAGGNLGLGNTTYYSSPKQVGALTTWAVVSVGGLFNAYAIKTDGTLWSWGSNTYGQLGINNTTAYSSPKQVGALTSWVDVSGGPAFCMGLRSDGTLWTWGNNANGQLGLGNTTYFSSPKQVGATSNWAKLGVMSGLNAPGEGFALAIRTNGTLWSWGLNSQGMLGINNTINYSSPKQVGSGSWANVSGGSYATIAVSSAGSLWTWGQGGNGQNGLGNTTQYNAPRQVGSDTTWVLGFMGQYSASAIKT